jgi:hypothetical protein
MLSLFTLVLLYQYAYRLSERTMDHYGNGTVIWKYDHEDDGEDGAGSKLSHLLYVLKEEGVVVVVSRWFGGIQLGPKRFVHIANVARDLLAQCHATHWK